MKFITEQEMRDMYRIAPFAVYEPLQNTRLTPGARQWLMDRNLINLEDDPREVGVTHGKSSVEISKKRAGQGAERGEKGCGSDRIDILMEALRCDFYKTGIALEQTAQSPASISGGLPFSRGSGGVQSPSEPMTGGVSGKALSAAGHLSNNLNALPRFNVGQANIESSEADVAKRVISIGDQIARLRDGMDIKPALEFKECTGIKDENFSDLLADCFDISACQAAMPRGEEIIILHLLRCKMRLLEQTVSESYGIKISGAKRDKYREGVLTGLRQIINTLSRMICAAQSSCACKKG